MTNAAAIICILLILAYLIAVVFENAMKIYRWWFPKK